jgi:hypothetical protein
MGTSDVICIPFFKRPVEFMRASCAPDLGKGLDSVVCFVVTV